MEFRSIKPEEKLSASKIQSIGFFGGNDFSGAKNEPERFQRGFETVRAAFNESGKMCACLQIHPYQVRFDGHTVDMGGIGGVATLPEERRKGYIKGLFKTILPEMYENHQIFSYLYPFSFPYYRKFGYELGTVHCRLSIPFLSLSAFPPDGEIRFYQAGEDHSAIEGIYSQFIQNKNLAIVRNNRLWDGWLNKDAYKENYFTYVWYDLDNVPKSYIIFKIQRKPEGKPDAAVQELIWLDHLSLCGILGHMNHFASQLDRLIWRAPESFGFDLLFPEPYDIKAETLPWGMNRIVNLKKVLELMQYPEEKGEMVLEVHDPLLEHNCGRFHICWEDHSVEVTPTGASADLICDIQSMTQLVTGTATPEDLALGNKIRIQDRLPVLNSVFRRKRQYINDYF